MVRIPATILSSKDENYGNPAEPDSSTKSHHFYTNDCLSNKPWFCSIEKDGINTHIGLGKKK